MTITQNIRKYALMVAVLLAGCLQGVTAQTTAKANPGTTANGNQKVVANANQDSTAQTPAGAKRPKVGLVLSGGGAKGMAHIGAIRVIERAGIPIDMVAGTSMGSIVGGLYACGKDAQTLDSIVRAQDWSQVFSDREDLSYQSLRERMKQHTYIYSRSILMGSEPGSAATGGGFMAGKNVMELLRKHTKPYTDSIDFSELPIPFACVATNMVDNTEYVFHSGVLSQAMRASMAIPAAFSPVRMGDMVLVDGGLRNNFPVDVAKDMGADIVIGVSTQNRLRTANELNSTASILMQVVDANCKNKFDENVKMADICILVDVEGYSAASFSKTAIDSLIRRGEEAAMAHWDQLEALGKQLRQQGATTINRRPSPITPHQEKRYAISEVKFENMTKMDALFLRTKFKMSEGDSIDENRASLIVTSIRRDLFYKDASYAINTFSNNPDRAVVTFTANSKKSSKLNVGLRFDNEEMVAVQANAALPLSTKLPAQAELTLRLGKRIMARADLALHPWSYVRPALSYIFRHNDISLYQEGLKNYSLTYNQHTAQLQLLNFNVRNMEFNAGARWDYYHYNNLLVNYRPESYMDIMPNEHFYTYYAQMVYNNENNWYFPTQGTRINAQFSYVSDDLLRLDGAVGMREYMLSIRTSLPLSSKFSVQPQLYARFLYGHTVPTILRNVIGGPFFGHYVAQQMPFPGLGFVENTGDKFVAAQMQLQFNATKSSIIQARFATAQQADVNRNLFKHRTLMGGELSYYFNSIFGPLGGSLGYSNISKQFYYYVNLGFEF